MKYKKIPIVKSRIVSPSKKRFPKLKLFGSIFFGLVVMIFYVWLKVQINLELAEIQLLEQTIRQQKRENDRLQAEYIKLSSFDRIHKIAQEDLGLIFLDSEAFHEIP